jgi:outer membrane protein OmpA-like peptidoglycan-associated protein
MTLMKKSNLAILLILIYIMCSCLASKSTVDSSKMALKTAKESNERALKMLDLMSEQAKKAEQEGKIATTANEEIQIYVTTEKQKIEQQNKEMQTSLAELENSKGVSNDAVKKANSLVMSSSNTLRIVEEKTKVIVDFLGNETFSKAEIGALFSAGEYKLVPSQMKDGEKIFKPVIDKIFSFANKYSGKYANLKGEIIITGYSDATPIEKNSRLYKDLAKGLGVEEPTITQLNQKLSEMRALAVKELLETIITKRKSTTKETLDIKILVFGRGEEIPRGLPSNLSKNDFKRRVVTFYWVVLPNL